jgi:hypothetical protein
MNKPTSINSILFCALLGVMMAGSANGADIRYKASGDYNATTNSTGDTYGWRTTGALPGAADNARFNWGNTAGNVVTLTNEASLINAFQMGVDESGALIVTNGGKLVAKAQSTLGLSCSSANTVSGKLTVYTGGQVVVSNVLAIGNSGNTGKPVVTGILTIDGGTVNTTSHVWIGCGTATNKGIIYITNSGTLNVGGNIGLGTIDASTPRTNCTGSLYVQDGGVLNLSQIAATNSIQPGSVLDISGSGVVIMPNDRTTAMNAYTNLGRITAYGGLGTVGIDYNNTNLGKTTLYAIAPLVGPPTNCVWNPALNVGDTNGHWNVSSNWDVGAVPASVTKVQFNVVDAIPCIVTNAAVANQVVIGDGGPGGALILTNGGSLTTGGGIWSAVGYNSNALMIVESGCSASFGQHLWVGLNPDADGTLMINGGTVSVGGAFGMGTSGGIGRAYVTNGAILNITTWNDFGAVVGSSVLDVSGTSQVIMNGNHKLSVEADVGSGRITANGGAGIVVVDYNNIHLGKTTIYVQGTSLVPEQAIWDPSLNVGDTNGLWNVSSNWTGAFAPGSVTVVKFNVLDAIPCTVTNAAVAGRIVMGESSGPGGTLIITNGTSLTVGPNDWSAIAYNSNAVMRVESGCTVNFGFQLWIGYNPNSDGTLIINGGTVNVASMIGLGWSGGKGTVQVNNGTLNLAQLNASQSISGASVLNVTGTGKVFITGNQTTSVSNYVSSGKITANGGSTVYYKYDAGANKTIISAVSFAPPQQSITSVSISGTDVTLTYETTAGNTYHIEETPSLSPASWTPVPGSTNTATGAPVPFTFPAGSGQMFYRTVSP